MNHHTLGAATAYDIQACLHDKARVELFRRAIRCTVGPGDVVIDAGSGTGLLGLFAAQAGAKTVYCVEGIRSAIPVIRENAARNGYAHVIVPVHADATQWSPPSQVDVIISEVISAGFFYEPQLQILNHLTQFLKPFGTLIPESMRNYVELIDAQESLYGLKFNYDSRFTHVEGDTSLTTREVYHSADFMSANHADIASAPRLRATHSGWANAARISYDITFPGGVVATEPTAFLLNPQIVFLDARVHLSEGDRYTVSLEYEASGSPLDAKIRVST